MQSLFKNNNLMLLVLYDKGTITIGICMIYIREIAYSRFLNIQSGEIKKEPSIFHGHFFFLTTLYVKHFLHMYR